MKPIPPMPLRLRDYYRRANFIVGALAALAGIVGFLLIGGLRSRTLLLRIDVYATVGAFMVSIFSIASPTFRWAENRAEWKRAHGWNKWWV